jgi:hypothetical protein
MTDNRMVLLARYFVLAAIGNCYMSIPGKVASRIQKPVCCSTTVDHDLFEHQ